MKEISKIITKIAVFYLVIAVISFGYDHTSANGMTISDKMDAEVKFVVYPNGTVGLSSKGNYTPAYPMIGPTFQVKAQLGKSADKYNALINTTLTVPPEEASQFPYNATSATMTTQYSNNMANTKLNASVILCDLFGGDLRGFPFNSTDFSIVGNYTNQKFNGTITIHLVPGFSLGDIDVNFEGNLTKVTLRDSVKVFYNYTLPIPGFPTLNETTLNGFLMMYNSTIPGTGVGSLYNMTRGMLTCTTFNTTLTPIDSNSARVSFLVIIQGDLIQFLVNTSMGSGVPSIPPSDMYSIMNATVYSVKSGEFAMSYSKTARKLDLQATFTQNLKEYWDANIKTLPNTYPPELRPYITLMLNTTYASVYSSTEKTTYSNGQMKYEGNYTLAEDLNAEINHIKNTYIDMLNATMPGSKWIVTTAKDTDVDITNLRLNFNVDNTSQRWDFEGIKAAPPIDRINATSFMLEKFFNLTSALPGGGPEPPTQDEKLKLTVQGESNGTHTVTLHIDPADPNKVPEPDAFADGNTMIWNNQSISKLRRLIFRVWEGHAETIFNPASVTPSNPYTIDAKQTANCTLIINGISKSATLSVKNVTAPTGVGALPGAYKLLGNYIQITSSVEDITVNVTIRTYYTTEQLSALGLDENSLKMFYWNGTANQWVAVETQVNTSEHYARATINHFSAWVLLGQPVPPLWEQPWFLISIAVLVVVVVIIIAVLVLRRKKQPPQTKETSGQ